MSTPIIPQDPAGFNPLVWLAERDVTFALPKGRTKDKFERDWQNTPHTLEQAQGHARSGGNVGILCGKHSNGVCPLDRDIDFWATVGMLGNLAHTAKVVRDNAPDRGKLLYRVIGELPPTKAWRANPGDKHPACEMLANGRHALIPPSEFANGHYRLIDTQYGIMEVTPAELDAIWFLITGEYLYPKAAQPTHSDDSHDYIQRVKAAWQTRDVFAHFGRDVNGSEQERKETRLLGNGGLLVNDYKWYCHADGVGGDQVDAWHYCEHGKRLDRGDGKAFWNTIDAMAVAGGIPKPARPAQAHQNVTTAPEAPIVGNGDTERRRPPTTAEYLAALAGLGYTFRQNSLDDTVEVNGQAISTGLAAEIRTRMRDLGYGNMGAVEDAYTAAAYKDSYHPVKNYLEGLTWDGGNHIAAMALYLKDAHPMIRYTDTRLGVRTVSHAFLLRWLVGAVAKIYEAGDVRGQNPMLVLDGAQGIGKSTWVRWIGSPLSYLTVEKAIQPDSKDDDRLLATRWIWEVSELGATTRRADREALKAFITRQEVTFRRPYDKHPVTKPALASFVGTLNNETGFLTDTTGNRRFLSVTLTEIAHDYVTRLDPNQLWAQAYALYRQGEAWQLLPEERAMRDKLNAGYEVESAYEGQILKLYDVADDPEACENEKRPGWFVTTADVAAKLQTYGVTGSTLAIQRDVTTTLRRLGLRPSRENGARGARGFWGLTLRGEYTNA